MRIQRLLQLTPLAVTLASACAIPITTGSTATSDLRPASYQTYSWDLADALPSGDPRLENNTVFLAEMRKAVDAEMSKMGLKHVESGGELLVHTHMAVRDRVDVWATDRDRGYDLGGYQGQQVRQYEEGTIVVDVAEARGKRLIWRGWIQTDLSGVIGKGSVLPDRMRKAISEVFLRFPRSCVAD